MGPSFGRLLGLLTLSLIVLLAADAGRELRAEAPKAKIVGLGAATCHQFTRKSLAKLTLDTGINWDAYS